MGEFHGMAVSPAYDYRATHITKATNVSTTTQNATSGTGLRYVQLAQNENVALGLPLLIDSSTSQETIFVASIVNIMTDSGSSAVPGAGAATITPTSMTGIVVNLALTCDTGGSQEVVIVTAVTATTFTATFATAHAAGFAIVSTAIGAVFAKSHASGVAVTGDTYPAVAPDAVSTFSPTSVVAGVATIAVGSLVNISAGVRLRISDGTNSEYFTVSSIDVVDGLLTATFTKSYQAPLYLTSAQGSWLGLVQINSGGTAMTLTLYDGNHENTDNALAIIASPSAGTHYCYWCRTERVLCYKYSGAAPGDITITALTQAA